MSKTIQKFDDIMLASGILIATIRDLEKLNQAEIARVVSVIKNELFQLSGAIADLDLQISHEKLEELTERRNEYERSAI
jgi:cob(I)alamin adenosyltransferase